MTAITVKVLGGHPSQRRPRPHFLEALTRRLIILCTALAVILSSMAVCDGHWLRAPGGCVFGLWHFCTLEARAPHGSSAASAGDGAINGALNGAMAGQEQTALGESTPLTDPAPWALPNCTALSLQSGPVGGGGAGLVLCRCVVSLAVVAAIFGLELQVMSQVSEGQDASRRWSLGSVLVLGAAVLSATGVVVFGALLRGVASPTGFTLTFWGQFTAALLFFLSGMAARHVSGMNGSALPGGTPPGKC